MDAEVQPGATRRVSITLDSKGQRLGFQRQAITLRSNDPLASTKTVELLYFIRPGLTIIPEAIRQFREVSLPAEYEVKVVPPSTGAYELVGFETDLPFVELSAPSCPAIFREKGIVIRLLVRDAKNWVGPVDGRVVLSLRNLTSERDETVVLPIYLLRIA